MVPNGSGSLLPTRSLQDFTGEACQVMQTLVPPAMLPIQDSLLASYWALEPPSSGAMIRLGSKMPMVSPFFAATALIWFTMPRLPAPGMLRTTTFGLPGMWLP